MKTISIALALVGAIVLAACGEPQAGAAAAHGQAADAAHLQREGATVAVPAASPLRQSLVVGTVELQAFAQTIAAPGVVEAAPEKLVRITPPLAGRIVRLHRQLGDAVRAGEPLATIDSPELGTAYSEHLKAQATLRQARQEFARQKALQDEDISAGKDFEAAQLALSTAETEAQAAGDRLAQRGASAGAGSRREYTLRAPIAGRVVEMNAAQGGYWNDTTASLMTVADLSTVWLSASVAEKDLAQLAVGQRAQILVNAYADREFTGQLNYIGDLLDPDTRTVRARIALDNRAGLLKPGMFARVRLSGASRSALLVPATALLQDGLSTRVFVEQAPFQYASRTVRVGASLADRVEVLSGLQAGERIVVHNGVLLHD
ncbi:MAG TPA: efflux RND transporter periplasmic adaptor subunit [Pseudorhodoferax sp.]|nr:efflux RND transporter periplasmic adaptor subunit [Pseudorhodoferax sp.]